MTPAPAGNQGILFIPGFTRHVVANGVLEEVKPRAVVYASHKCGYVGCTFATESESGLSTHRRYCKFKTDRTRSLVTARQRMFWRCSAPMASLLMPARMTRTLMQTTETTCQWRAAS